MPIRFEGIDAPEEHYRATPFKRERPDGTEEQFPFDPSKPHPELSQPQWKAATVYALRTLEKAGWALVLLDREVTDRYGRVLGYVYTSDSSGAKGTFVSLQLVAKGLAFPFLFESSGDMIPQFLEAPAKRGPLGLASGLTTRTRLPYPTARAFPAKALHRRRASRSGRRPPKLADGLPPRGGLRAASGSEADGSATEVRRDRLRDWSARSGRPVPHDSDPEPGSGRRIATSKSTQAQGLDSKHSRKRHLCSGKSGALPDWLRGRESGHHRTDPNRRIAKQFEWENKPARQGGIGLATWSPP